MLGLIVHLTALIGDYDLSRKIPFLRLLHVGIFIVWIPTILLLRKKTEAEDNKVQIKPRAFSKSLFSETPAWLKVIAIAGFVYAFINFMLFTASQSGTPDIKGGQYILHSHGKLIRALTEQEYNHYLANQTRGFSGHWIAFYGFAAAVLFPFNKRRQVTAN